MLFGLLTLLSLGLVASIENCLLHFITKEKLKEIEVSCKNKYCVHTHKSLWILVVIFYLF